MMQLTERAPAIPVPALAEAHWHAVPAGLCTLAMGECRPPPLPADQAELWRIPLPLSSVAMAEWEQVLTPAERQRAAQFRRSEDQARFTVGRAATRLVLGGYAEVRPQAVTLLIGANGKPLQECDDERERIHFNVSHSGSWVLLAFSRGGPVGIDVEVMRPLDVAELARHCLDEREYAFVTCDDARASARFYRLWTRKEAFLKATGEGIGPGLRRVHMLAGGREPIARASHTISDLDMPEGYAAAVALPPPVRAARLMQVEPSFNER